MSDCLDKFEAGFIHANQDEYVVMVGLADDQFNTNQYILLQRTLEPSEQDIALQQDGVHLMVCDQSRSCYGGLLSVVVTQDCVIFNFDADAASNLKVKTQLVVDITGAETDPDALTIELQKVCGNYAFVRRNN